MKKIFAVSLLAMGLSVYAGEGQVKASFSITGDKAQALYSHLANHFDTKVNIGINRDYVSVKDVLVTLYTDREPDLQYTDAFEFPKPILKEFKSQDTVPAFFSALESLGMAPYTNGGQGPKVFSLQTIKCASGLDGASCQINFERNL